MRSKLPAILTGVLLVLFGASAWFLAGIGRQAQPLTSAAQAAETELSVADKVPAASLSEVQETRSEREPSRPTSVVAEAAPDPGSALEFVNARVIGRCVDVSGRGIEGVRVRCAARSLEAASDASGHFELSLDLAEGAPDVLRLELSRERFGRTWRGATVHAAEDVDLGEIVLEAGGLLAGRVVDANGLVLPLARIAVEQAGSLVQGGRFDGPRQPLLRDRCDERGEFRLPDVPVGLVRVWAGAEDMRWSWSDALEVTPQRDLTDIVLRVEPLKREDTIQLIVLDPGGEPAQRANVRYRYGDSYRSGSGTITTDSEGRGRMFMKVRAAHSFLASDRNEKHRSAFASDVPPGTHDLVLQLTEHQSFRLEVRDERSLPVLHYRVAIEDVKDQIGGIGGGPGKGPHSEGRTEIVTPVVPFKLIIEAEGFEREVLGPFDPDAVSARLDAVLVALPAVRGRVLAGGEALSGAAVSLHEAVGNRLNYVINGFPCRSRKSSVARATSDSEGAFELTLRQAGRYYLRAETEGLAAADVGPFELGPHVGASGLGIELGPGGVLEGRVRGAGALNSPSGMIVGVSRADGFGITARSGDEGQYRFEGLAPGRWLLELREEEIHPHSTNSSTRMSDREIEIPWNCEVWEGQTTAFDLNLDLLHAAIFEGSALMAGEALRGWEISLSRVEGGQQDSKKATLDSLGAFRVPLRESGRYRVSLQGLIDGRCQAYVTDEVAIEAGQNRWDLDLAAGDLSGRVSSALPDGSSGLRFQWQGEGRLGAYVRIPVEDGAFEVPGLPAGPGKLFLRGPDGRETPHEVRIPERGGVEVELP